MSESTQYCTFMVDGLTFGVAVQSVQEVLRYQEMTRVPLASSVVGGLINLRGQIVTAIDLRERLGLGRRDEELVPMNVVIRSDDAAISLLVDEIGDVLDVPADAYEQTPRNLRGPTRELVRGVYKLKDCLLLVLDIDKAVAVESSPGKARDTH